MVIRIGPKLTCGSAVVPRMRSAASHPIDLDCVKIVKRVCRNLRNIRTISTGRVQYPVHIRLLGHGLRKTNTGSARQVVIMLDLVEPDLSTYDLQIGTQPGSLRLRCSRPKLRNNNRTQNAQYNDHNKNLN